MVFTSGRRLEAVGIAPSGYCARTSNSVTNANSTLHLGTALGIIRRRGRVAEWLKAHAWKACMR